MGLAKSINYLLFAMNKYLKLKPQKRASKLEKANQTTRNYRFLLGAPQQPLYKDSDPGFPNHQRMTECLVIWGKLECLDSVVLMESPRWSV